MAGLSSFPADTYTWATVSCDVLQCLDAVSACLSESSQCAELLGVSKDTDRSTERRSLLSLPQWDYSIFYYMNP